MKNNPTNGFWGHFMEQKGNHIFDTPLSLANLELFLEKWAKESTSFISYLWSVID